VLDENSQRKTALEEKAADSGVDNATLLLFKLNETSRFAMPLSMVSRLEEFPVKNIERANERDVIQYRGQVMPLIRMSDQLGLTPPAEAETMPVIVFDNGARTIGMIVHKILDVVEEAAKPRKDSARTGVLGSAIVQGHTTVFVDPYALIEHAEPGFFKRDDSHEESKAVKSASRRVLVVDDSAFFRGLSRSYLDLAGYRVVEACNGAEALERLKGGSIDAVICDLEMPVMNGWEFARNVRKAGNFRHLPLIALTTLDNAESRMQAQDAGYDQYLVKIDRESMLSTLEKSCSQAHASQSAEAVERKG
jgi:two-component system chemotaxis sensor kinase CheA